MEWFGTWDFASTLHYTYYTGWLGNVRNNNSEEMEDRKLNEDCVFKMSHQDLGFGDIGWFMKTMNSHIFVEMANFSLIFYRIGSYCVYGRTDGQKRIWELVRHQLVDLHSLRTFPAHNSKNCRHNKCMFVKYNFSSLDIIMPL